MKTEDEISNKSLRKAAEEALRETEKKFRTLFETSNDAIYLHEMAPDGPGRILLANAAASEMLGYTNEEFLELDVTELNDPAYEKILSSLLNELKTDQVKTFEWAHLTKDGRSLSVEISLTLFESGGRTLAVSSFRDISDRKQAEQLSDSIFDQAGEAIVVCDASGIVSRANRAARLLAGMNPLGKPFTEAFPIVPSEKMTTKSMIASFLEGTTFIGIEVQLGSENNTESYYLFSGTPVFNESNEILRLVVVLSDITEQKKSNERILQLNQMLLTIRNINRLLVRERDPDLLLQEVCDIKGESKGFENAWVVRSDENGVILRAYESGPGTSFVELEIFLQQGDLPWCLREALQQEGVMAIETLREECLTCPLVKICEGRITLTCSLRYEEENYGVLSARLPKKLPLKEEEVHLFKEVCDDVAFGLHIAGLEERENRALAQIQQNMMQLAAMNDEIRNPLTVIRMLNSMESTEENMKTIDEQIVLIDETIQRLDKGWINSEKIWHYLNVHYGIQSPDKGKLVR